MNRRFSDQRIGLARRAIAVCGVVLAATLAPSSPAVVGTSAEPVTARDVLESLDQHAESAVARYSRSSFRHWVDEDGDCQDARQEVLVRDSVRPAVGRCRVTRGVWVSWLDGKRHRNPSQMDVDHLVALAEAWSSGASAWTADQRRAFANDLGYAWSLQAVTASVNRSKSDKDPGEWLPRNAAVRCAYAQRWVAVKHRWNLSVDPKERSALDGLLAGTCGDEVIEVPPVVTGIPDHGGSAPPVDGDPEPAPDPGTPLPTVRPGAFCATSAAGTQGVGSNGLVYTCKRSATDSRLRWRR